jgi:hypothetical protein
MQDARDALTAQSSACGNAAGPSGGPSTTS